MDTLHVYNTLTRQKEKFEPITPPHVGMYVCGPTVYSDAHLGHARSAIAFDIIFRWLTHLEYKVRFVRNITDVGHMESDFGDGEDKMLKRAKLEELEPMEVAQKYTNSYHDDLDRLNCRRPSIEPCASGHIPEQIALVQKILENGFAYEIDGNVYFDVMKYNEQFQYAKLSGRGVDESISGSRDNLAGQDEKKHPADFALWKKAPAEHIMKWDSPWGEGFPGWHLECTVMSTKYLGQKYDIHGGGLDLIFPHHDGEIAQSNAAIADPHSHHLDEAKYWLHNNMITITKTKMAKSLGNFITIGQVFSGDHPQLEQAYSPQAVRFYCLQCHYRSVLDFSNKALQAADNAFQRLSAVYHKLNSISPDTFSGVEIDEEQNKNLATFAQDFTAFMNDDFNTARALARMFEVVPVVNQMASGKLDKFPVDPGLFATFRKQYQTFFVEVLGLTPSEEAGGAMSNELADGMMQLIIALRADARQEKNWAIADKIRDGLSPLKIKLKDTPKGTEWYVED